MPLSFSSAAAEFQKSRFARALLLGLLLTAARPAWAQTPTPSPSARPAPTEAPTAAPGDYHPPKLLNRTPMAYPEIAKVNRLQGVVKLLFTVDDAGRVAEVVVLRGSGSLWLDQVIEDPALRQWTFQPATLNGRPVTGTSEQELEFRLDPEEQRALGAKRAALPPTTGTPDPPYPEAARAKNLSGRITLSVSWTDRGLVDHLYVLQSSGSGLLDRAAVRFAYENWRVDREKVKEPQFVKTIVFDPAAKPVTAR